MLKQITARQFVMWEHFVQLEGPISDLRQDYLFASVVQMLANINRDSKRRSEPYTIDEMRLKFGEHEDRVPKHQTWQDQKAIFLGPIAAAYSVEAKDA